MRLGRRGFIELTAASAAISALAHAEEHKSPMVTADSIDPVFGEPVIEVNEDRTDPEPHRYVHGSFKGAAGKFSFYFPPKERYQGRFFHNTYPLLTSSDVGPSPIGFKVNEGNLGFVFASGGYYVQTDQGGSFSVRMDHDPSISSGYRLNAAAAKFSRIVAQQVYGKIPRPYGYLHGGSGGGYQTMGCAEYTSGVWDGFLPYVVGSPFTGNSRPLAQYVLNKRNKQREVVDALDPGGSGDPYATLNEVERAVLKEATQMGFPLRGWYQYDGPVAGGGGGGNDPTYVEDFWTKPGYFGAEPNAWVRADRIQYETTIAKVTAGPPATIELASVPDRDLAGAQLVILSGAAAGKTVSMARLQGKTITLGGGGGAGGLAAIAAGAAGGGFGGGGGGGLPQGLQAEDKVRIDNSAFLAGLFRHRYTLPPLKSIYTYDQFRGRDGKPLYPQRAEEPLSQGGGYTSSGGEATGRITAKVLCMQSMVDINACAWNADWYRNNVKAALGPKYADSFVLWFVDNAQHDVPGYFGTQGLEKKAWGRMISHVGQLQQGLRDLALWVEKGVRPSETQYKMVDTAQVQLPARARDRKGIQSVPTLEANGKARAEVKAGTPVKFAGTIEVPPGAGKVVAVEWDYEGTGDRFPKETVPKPDVKVSVSGEHTYTMPGTYFAVMRVFSQREGDPNTPYAQVMNVARARVVVS